MANSKKQQARTDRRRKKIMNLISVIVCAVAVIGLILALVFLIDWGNPSSQQRPSYTDHVHGPACDHPF